MMKYSAEPDSLLALTLREGLTNDIEVDRLLIDIELRRQVVLVLGK